MNTSSHSPSSSSPSSAANRWRLARRLLVAVAAVATGIAVFYTIENWRGKRAWDTCRRALEAKGEVLDWAAYIPKPVPDEQNFYKAPKMREWFVKGAQPANAPEPFVPVPRKDTSLLLAEIKLAAPNAPSDSPPADAVLRFDDPSAREQAAKLLGEAIGPCAIGSKQCVLLARPLDQVKSLHLALQADSVPTVKELAAFFPANPLTNSALAYSDTNYLQIEPAGSNAFRISLKAPVYAAADYLAWTEPLTADFDRVRQAVERPYARIDCDYQQPHAIVIPSFIGLRNMSRILAQRAQSHLLLGQPEAAWHELALVHDLSQILAAKPPHKPVTLVGAMINVAVVGLYAETIADGLRLHAWREPQLLALERQLQQTDLLAPVVQAFGEEWAAHLRTIEGTTRNELVKLIGASGPTPTLLGWIPRGWLYQNLVVGAETAQELLASVDATNRLIQPSRVSEIIGRVSLKSAQRSPYRFLASAANDNKGKVVQVLARNTTIADQARLACALERYRLAQGQYPESLDALAARFIENLPHDLVGGQPLKYRRTEDGGYLLYSVGWNEKDDGGVIGKSREEGDWVWEIR